MSDPRFAPFTLSSRKRDEYIARVREFAAARELAWPADPRAAAVAATSLAAGVDPGVAMIAIAKAQHAKWREVPSIGALRAREIYEEVWSGTQNRDVPGWSMSTLRTVFDELEAGSTERRAALVAWVLERRQAEKQWPRWSIEAAPDLWLNMDLLPSQVRVIGDVQKDEPLVVDGSYAVPVRDAWIVVSKPAAERVLAEALSWAQVNWPEAYGLLHSGDPSVTARKALLEAYVRGLTLFEAIDLSLDAEVHGG